MTEAKTQRIKKCWFWFSIIVNIGFLGVFKYYNFFVESFAEAVTFFGLTANYSTLNFILPVGISFYTFHGLSYVIDIYKQRIEPERSFINYSVFVSFFPLLVAGPIERATHLLPQIKKVRIFDYSKMIDGLRQILWGLFKKIVIADQCAEYANLIFKDQESYPGSMLVLGAIFFAVQIYCDFSGYSDIALGTARLFGIELLRNFSFPYFSRNIAEFWRRWHISLSSWFRDYLYIPMGGSKGSVGMTVRNIMVIFLVSGFWHGANWTFIIWGLLNALYILPSVLIKTTRDHLDIVAQGKLFPSLKDLFAMGSTFCLVLFAWIFFRSENLEQALNYASKIFSTSLFTIPPISILELPLLKFKMLMILVFIFFIIEWIGREQMYALAHFGLKWPRQLRWATYYSIIIAIFHFSGADQQFIYFQF